MGHVGWSLFAVALLLVANAFFVAAEFALVKVRGFQLEQAMVENRRAAALSTRMHGKLDAYLAACQLGITMASLGLGWVGEPAVAALLEPLFHKLGVSDASLHTVSFLIGFLIFSSLHIVIGEQVPKTYAIRNPRPVTLALAYPLQAFYLLVYPLNWALERANALVLRALGVPGGSHHEVISEEEISAIVSQSEAHGELEEKTADIIRKAFRFDDQTVREIMVPWIDVDTLRLGASAEDNQAMVVDALHSRFPVVNNDGQVMGILTTKDVMTALLKGDTELWANLEKYLRKPLTIPDSLLISLLLEQMRTSRIHMAIVVDEYGSYTGIVTLEDMLEEIVGEIDDEWDAEASPLPIEIVDGGWLANGQLSLGDLSLAIGSTVASDDATTATLGGWLMSELQRIPAEGDRLIYGEYCFEVAKMIGRRVHSVAIIPDTKDEKIDD